MIRAVLFFFGIGAALGLFFGPSAGRMLRDCYPRTQGGGHQASFRVQWSPHSCGRAGWWHRRCARRSGKRLLKNRSSNVRGRTMSATFAPTNPVASFRYRKNWRARIQAQSRPRKEGRRLSFGILRWFPQTRTLKSGFFYFNTYWQSQYFCYILIALILFEAPNVLKPRSSPWTDPILGPKDVATDRGHCFSSLGTTFYFWGCSPVCSRAWHDPLTKTKRLQTWKSRSKIWGRKRRPQQLLMTVTGFTRLRWTNKPRRLWMTSKPKPPCLKKDHQPPKKSSTSQTAGTEDRKEGRGKAENSKPLAETPKGKSAKRRTQCQKPKSHCAERSRRESLWHWGSEVD